jgi:hypothetical protein
MKKESAGSRTIMSCKNTQKGINWIRELLGLTTAMENPLTPVKNVREVWNKNLNQKVKEVLVQVKNESPAWIPLETLLALQNAKNERTDQTHFSTSTN